MPAKDIFHDALKNALISDDWAITNDPLTLKIGGFDLYIDLGAEKLVAAEKAGVKIAVEIKSFLQSSFITELHLAIGQFINYRTALYEKEPERQLYLAIPDDTYQQYFMHPFVKKVVEENQLKLIVFDSETEVIVQWEI